MIFCADFNEFCSSEDKYEAHIKIKVKVRIKVEIKVKIK